MQLLNKDWGHKSSLYSFCLHASQTPTTLSWVNDQNCIPTAHFSVVHAVFSSLLKFIYLPPKASPQNEYITICWTLTQHHNTWTTLSHLAPHNAHSDLPSLPLCLPSSSFKPCVPDLNLNSSLVLHHHLTSCYIFSLLCSIVCSLCILFCALYRDFINYWTLPHGGVQGSALYYRYRYRTICQQIFSWLSRYSIALNITK